MILASPSRRSNRLLDARMRGACRPWTKRFREAYAKEEAERVAKMVYFERMLYGIVGFLAWLVRKDTES